MYVYYIIPEISNKQAQMLYRKSISPIPLEHGSGLWGSLAIELISVTIRAMFALGDDEVASILNWVTEKNDRKSFSQVCKQWLRVEGLTRSAIRVLEPESLRHFLPRFPNLVTFQSSASISSTDLEFVSQICPKIEVLNLNVYKSVRGAFDGYGSKSSDVGSDGLCAMAIGCEKLLKVALRRRCNVRDDGVVSVVQFAPNLTHLDLGRCGRITDRALEAIGEAGSISSLNLQGCSLITDLGLSSLVKGPLCRTLRKLVLAECDQISDKGVSFLHQMDCLEELNLADCGAKITDKGGLVVATIGTLKKLDLSWLINVSDITIVALAENCENLVGVDLTGCEFVTGAGIRAFVDHQCLEALVLVSCYSVCADDVEQMVLGCRSLTYLLLDKGLRTWMSRTVQENIGNFCELHWR